jgi:hypothetical protein
MMPAARRDIRSSKPPKVRFLARNAVASPNAQSSFEPERGNVGDCKGSKNKKHFLLTFLHSVSIYVDHIQGSFASAKTTVTTI